jgi:HSP20 family protein
MKKDEIEVSFKDKRLTISGERKKEEKEEKKDYIRQERYHGRFVRSYTLPSEVQEEDIKASFHNGVLTVKVPKSEVSKPKTINIEG